MEHTTYIYKPGEEPVRVLDMKAFYTSLAKVQAEIGTAAKDKKNSHFGSKYADLASVWEAWQEVGPKNGFGVLQRVLDAGERQGVIIETILTHESGESLNSEAYFPANKNDAQAFGSAITYGRRYSLAALVGICPDDDDGNAASGKPANDAGYRTKLEDAIQKFRDDKNKLLLLRGEAEKSRFSDLVQHIDSRLKEVQ